MDRDNGEKLNQKYIDAKLRATLRKEDNLHELPYEERLPPGQRVVPKMVAMPPIIDGYPHVEKSDWRLHVYGEVEQEMTWNWQHFIALELHEYTVDFHCVTHWSKLGQKFSGVPLEELFKLVKPKDTARYIIFECYDGYTTNVVLEELKGHRAFIAVKMDESEIPDKFGGPARVVIPHLYGWKSAKHINALRFQSDDEPGFWEVRGYHNHADPWKEERYS